MNGSAAQTPRTILLSPSDNVVAAVDTVDKGVVVNGVTAIDRIPRGHKMSLVGLAEGEPVIKFGQIIGFATKAVPPGSWLHEHNVGMRDFARDYRFSEDAREEEILPVAQQATFEGFRRTNGKVGTRNYIAILTSVNCSASAARFMAQEIERSGILNDAY